MKTIEFVIVHDGKEWVVRNGAIVVAAPTLPRLDAKVRKVVRQAGLVGDGETARVRMAFDMSTIPQWIRQYSQHYFNRVITVEG